MDLVVRVPGAPAGGNGRGTCCDRPNMGDANGMRLWTGFFWARWLMLDWSMIRLRVEMEIEGGRKNSDKLMKS